MKPGKFENYIDPIAGRFGVICRCHYLNSFDYYSEPEELQHIHCSRCEGQAEICGKHDARGRGCTLLAGHEQDKVPCTDSTGQTLKIESENITLSVPRHLSKALRLLLLTHAGERLAAAARLGSHLDEREARAWLALADTVDP